MCYGLLSLRFFWAITVVILFHRLAKEGDKEAGGEGEEYQKTEEKVTELIKTWARKIDGEANDRSH
jgi:hypothetical protein